MLTVQCTAIFISEERMTNDHDRIEYLDTQSYWRKCKNVSSFKEEH